jgi:hypothetical protein
MQETLVNYHALTLSKNISVLRHTRSQGQGQVVDFITFYSTANVFELLLHTRAVNARILKRN